MRTLYIQCKRKVWFTSTIIVTVYNTPCVLLTTQKNFFFCEIILLEIHCLLWIKIAKQQTRQVGYQHLFIFRFLRISKIFEKDRKKEPNFFGNNKKRIYNNSKVFLGKLLRKYCFCVRAVTLNAQPFFVYRWCKFPRKCKSVVCISKGL